VRENILCCALMVVISVQAHVLGYLAMAMEIQVMGYLRTMIPVNDDADGGVS
jgi:hypothetical protein